MLFFPEDFLNFREILFEEVLEKIKRMVSTLVSRLDLYRTDNFGHRLRKISMSYDSFMLLSLANMFRLIDEQSNFHCKFLVVVSCISVLSDYEIRTFL